MSRFELQNYIGSYGYAAGFSATVGRARKQKFSATGADEELYALSAEEIYGKFARGSIPDMWLELSREEIAADLAKEEKLNLGDAYYVADQILVAAQAIVDSPDTLKADQI